MILKVQLTNGQFAFYEGMRIEFEELLYKNVSGSLDRYDHHHLLWGSELNLLGTDYLMVAYICDSNNILYTVAFNLHAWLMENGKTVDSFHPCNLHAEANG